MDLELHPMGKPKPCDVEKCVNKEKCLLHGAMKDGVEKNFTPKLEPQFGPEITIICHEHDEGKASG